MPFGAVMKKHAEKEPGHGGDVGDPFPGDGLEDAVHVELVHHDHGGPQFQGAYHVGGGAEGVEEGDEAKAHVALPALADFTEERALGGHVPVGEDGPQGPAGEPRRVDHHCRVIAPDGRGLEFGAVSVQGLPEG